MKDTPARASFEDLLCTLWAWGSLPSGLSMNFNINSSGDGNRHDRLCLCCINVVSELLTVRSEHQPEQGLESLATLTQKAHQKHSKATNDKRAQKLGSRDYKE